MSNNEPNDSFYRTIVDSPEWKVWYKEMMRRMEVANKVMNYKGCYDIDEAQECGVISPGHWKEFIRFTVQKEIDLYCPDCLGCVCQKGKCDVHDGYKE